MAMRFMGIPFPGGPVSASCRGRNLWRINAEGAGAERGAVSERSSDRVVISDLLAGDHERSRGCSGGRTREADGDSRQDADKKTRHLTIAPPFIETGEYAGITKRERKQEGNKDSASSGAIIIFPPGPIEGGAGVKFGGSRETRDQVDERRFSDYRPASIGAGRESNSQGRGDGFRASTGNVGGCLRCRNHSPPSTSRGIDVVLKQASALLAIQSRVISSKPKETTRLRLDRQAPIDAHQNPPDGPLDHLADLSVQTAAKSISYSVAHLPWTSTPLRQKLYS